MAATLTTKFWNGSSFIGPSQIVFTSPNIDSPAAIGTRSHVLPDLMDIALWYEGSTNMYRITDTQAAPSSVLFEYHGELHSSFDFSAGNTTMTLYDQTGSTSDWPTAGRVYYTDADYFDYTSKVWNATDITLGAGTDTGTETATSGTDIFLDPDLADVNFENSIVYEMLLGEAYNVYLTAWDDDSHTTTDNAVISGSHYKVTGAACYITGDENTPRPAGGSTYGTLVDEPVVDQVLEGNSNKWSLSTPLRYNAVDSGVSGAFLFFKPRLDGMDVAGLPAGNYDFVTTLHYQYT